MVQALLSQNMLHEVTIMIQIIIVQKEEAKVNTLTKSSDKLGVVLLQKLVITDQLSNTVETLKTME